MGRRGRTEVRDVDYERLLEFRTRLRRFLKWSEEQAATLGLTPTQHQLLLAVRGHRGPGLPTIRDVAQVLLLKHHSAVELVDRAESADLLVRQPDDTDRRRVRLALTGAGRRKLEQVTRRNLHELGRLGFRLPDVRASD